MKVYVSNGDSAVREMFYDRGHTIATSPSDSDVIVFTGGADISPVFYGERMHEKTRPFFIRDLEEISLWKTVDPDFPKVGICRGAQLGNVLCGGSLWQNVNNHAFGHHIAKDKSGKYFTVTTCHHQMCILTKDAYTEATTNISTKKERINCKVEYARGENLDDDPEAFFYRNFNFLGVQFHPEWKHKTSEEYFFDLFNKYYQHQS